MVSIESKMLALIGLIATEIQDRQGEKNETHQSSQKVKIRNKWVQQENTLNSLADSDRDTRKESGKVGQVFSAQLYKVMKPGAQVTKTQPEVNVKAKIKPQDHRRLTWKARLSFTLYKAKPYISVFGASECRARQHSRCVLAPEWQLQPSQCFISGVVCACPIVTNCSFNIQINSFSLRCPN